MNIKADIESYLKRSGWSVLRLAHEACVNKDSIYRLLKGNRKGVNSSTLEKLWPYLYGDKCSPSPLIDSADQSLKDYARNNVAL